MEQQLKKLNFEVASFTDAWIETLEQQLKTLNFEVASFTDAWIETIYEAQKKNLKQSHLLQMRGLKQRVSALCL